MYRFPNCSPFHRFFLYYLSPFYHFLPFSIQLLCNPFHFPSPVMWAQRKFPIYGMGTVCTYTYRSRMYIGTDIDLIPAVGWRLSRRQVGQLLAAGHLALQRVRLKHAGQACAWQLRGLKGQTHEINPQKNNIHHNTWIYSATTFVILGEIYVDFQCCILNFSSYCKTTQSRLHMIK